MTKPLELDMPHWAVREVNRTRSVWNLSSCVTDRMIFAALTRDYESDSDDRVQQLVAWDNEQIKVELTQ